MKIKKFSKKPSDVEKRIGAKPIVCYPNTNIEDSKVFLDWLLSNEGQNSIKKYKVNGVQLFYPNAN